MATYTKFLDYVEQLNKAVHNWSSHTFKGAATNTAPVNTNTVFANLTEISAGNGYSAGGMTLDTVTLSETSGTAKVTIADEVLTASGGSIGPLRYVSIYNDTPTSPADPLVAFYDYGSSITLAAGESFTIDFDATNGLWQLA
jgi:DUF4097 and DUF4098 domain-containing protein YvlB